MPLYQGQPLCPFAEEMAQAILAHQEAGTLDTEQARKSIDREEVEREISHVERAVLLQLFFQS